MARHARLFACLGFVLCCAVMYCGSASGFVTNNLPVCRRLGLAREGSRGQYFGTVAARGMHGRRTDVLHGGGSVIPLEKRGARRDVGRMSLDLTGATLGGGAGLGGVSEALAAAAPIGSSLLVLTIVIALHEAGHFVAARSQGIRVKTFSIGFGPKLISYKANGHGGGGLLWPSLKGGTRRRPLATGGPRAEQEVVEYTLRAIPVGGFVSFPNNWEADKEGNVTEFDDPDLLQNRGPGQRAAVVVAGVVANVLLAWGCMLGYISINGVMRNIFSPGVVVNEVIDRSGPATKAGIHTKDVLLSMNGQSLGADRKSIDRAIGTIRASGGKPVALEISRIEGKGTVLTTKMVQPTMSDSGKYTIGVRLGPNLESVQRSKPGGPAEALAMSLDETVGLIRVTFESLLQLAMSGSTEGMSGPVEIVKVGAEVATVDGPSALLQFAAVVSVNLAVVNSLPVPGLDGGQMVFIIAELIGRRKLDRGVMETINGVALLILFMISLSTFANDLGAVTLFQRFVSGALTPPS